MIIVVPPLLVGLYSVNGLVNKYIVNVLRLKGDDVNESSQQTSVPDESNSGCLRGWC
jgi:hypothetical protein